MRRPISPPLMGFLPDCRRSRATYLIARMSLFHRATFFTTAAKLGNLTFNSRAEVAFAGRSNAGKSSAINTLANQKRMAFTSKTPGRTQQLNYFALGEAVSYTHLTLPTIYSV